jgi:hypothetical protein
MRDAPQAIDDHVDHSGLLPRLDCCLMHERRGEFGTSAPSHDHRTSGQSLRRQSHPSVCGQKPLCG